MNRFATKVVYPDSDGKPMADNTFQFQWIQTIQGGLNALFRDRPDVFVAGDNLIYPVPGKPKIRQAPDVYAAFGRPKGRRGSYKVWEEGGIFPQVIFEILSPSNRPTEMARKLLFYERYGAEEYYVYDPDRVKLDIHQREAPGRFGPQPDATGFISPRLGLTFDLSGPELVIRRPDGQPLWTYVDAIARGEAAQAELASLREKLKAAGIDPDALG